MVQSVSRDNMDEHTEGRVVQSVSRDNVDGRREGWFSQRHVIILMDGGKGGSVSVT